MNLKDKLIANAKQSMEEFNCDQYREWEDKFTWNVPESDLNLEDVNTLLAVSLKLACVDCQVETVSSVTERWACQTKTVADLLQHYVEWTFYQDQLLFKRIWDDLWEHKNNL